MAQRLNDQHQRSKNLPKLKVLLQTNIDNEATKSGVLVEQIDELVTQFESLKNLTLRGFMCIPNSSNSAQSFARMANIIKQYSNLDVLSMGMSHDLESAITHGATFVRVGTDIFGKRI
ncbi:alanine racemase [Isorropodon fossajaponicum symbiont]|uniref:alanine racemase n=1 Tax=Isorropodon fossajaponicum symbiont TaxID=883811 RepID=UPI001CECB49B